MDCITWIIHYVEEKVHLELLKQKRLNIYVLERYSVV
jgi:hypothetical protein